MSIDFPKTEYLLTNRMEVLSEEQRRWSGLLTFRESIVNCAAGRYVGLLKDGCREMFLSEFLDSTYAGIEPFLNSRCHGMLLVDDFIFIAGTASKALKNIVNSPSSRHIKVEEQVKYNKVTNTGIKTMRWLAHRPGSTIAEKIAPSNKVLNVSTRFTLDTKENEASMYLYGIVYSVLSNRLFKSECRSCRDHNCMHKRHFEELENLYALNNTIRRSELKDVPRVRHSIQNNKLMCDPNYKTVWDCNLRLSRMEQGMRAEWSNLTEILYSDLYYCILSVILHSKGVKLHDVAGEITFAEDGRLEFTGADKVTFILHGKNELRRITVSLYGHGIAVRTSTLKNHNGVYGMEAVRECNIDLTPCVEALEEIAHAVCTEAEASSETAAETQPLQTEGSELPSAQQEEHEKSKGGEK